MTLWSGRLGEEGGREAMGFTASFAFDRRFFAEDIAASIAHAEMLGLKKIIKPAEAEELVAGLERLRERVVGQGFSRERGR